MSSDLLLWNDNLARLSVIGSRNRMVEETNGTHNLSHFFYSVHCVRWIAVDLRVRKQLCDEKTEISKQTMTATFVNISRKFSPTKKKHKLFAQSNSCGSFLPVFLGQSLLHTSHQQPFHFPQLNCLLAYLTYKYHHKLRTNERNPASQIMATIVKLFLRCSYQFVTSQVKYLRQLSETIQWIQVRRLPITSQGVRIESDFFDCRTERLLLVAKHKYRICKLC